MNLTDILIASVSSTALVSILAYLARNWISERIKQSIKYEYDLKLKEVENKYDKEQISLKAEIERDISIYKYKLEQVHPKRTQLIEKICMEIRKLDQEIDACLSMFEIIGAPPDLTEFSEIIDGIMNKEVEFSQFTAMAELYLTSELIKSLKEIKNRLAFTTLKMKQFVKKKDTFNDDTFSSLKEDFHINTQTLIENFFILSRNVINEKET